MIGIDSLDSSSASAMFKLSKMSEEEATRNKPMISRDKDGDTVNISAEALDLFKSKMDEYGTKDPGKLTAEQKDDLKETMESFAEENGIDPKNMPRPGGMPPAGMPPGGDGQGGTDGEKGGRPSSGSKEAGAAGGAKGSSSTEESTDVDDKKAEIATTEEEIEQLRGKAGNDEEAAEELKTKQTELLILQAELAQLQQSGT